MLNTLDMYMNGIDNILMWIINQATLPSTGNELDDRSEQEKRAVEGKPHSLPVWSQQAIQHFKPL